MRKILWLTTSSMSLEPIINSLQNYEVCEEERIFFDKISDHYAADIVDHQVEVFQPDAILYAGPANGPFMPNPLAIRRLRDKAPIVNIICDGGCPGSHPGIEAFQKAESFTFHVNIDGMTDWPHRQKDITTLCPIDSRYYEKKPPMQDIHLGFFGGDGHKERRDVLDSLGNQVVRGIRNEKYGSYQDYADFLMRCKYSLNMAANGSNSGMHCKARVIEVGLAGGCLLEQADSPINRYFEPDEDYLEWRSVYGIDTILKHTTEGRRQELAASLSRKVSLLYSARHFWGRVFDNIPK